MTLRRLCTTGGPTVRLGTKWPSITSTCNTEPPPSMACWAWAPNCAKSDDRIDGTSSIFIGRHSFRRCCLTKVLSPIQKRRVSCGVPTLNVQPHVMPCAVHPRFCSGNGNAQLLSRFTRRAATQLAQQHYAPELRVETRDRMMNCDLNFLVLTALFRGGS